MLFEMLTGHQPYTGETPLAVAYRHVNETVPPPSSLVPGLPPALDSLVALATSRDPDLRPADAGQFLRAISGARHGLPLDVPAAPGVPYAAVTGPAAHDASSADTTPPRAVVAPVWPGPKPAGWPGQSEAPTGGWPQMPAAGWPDPPQNANDLDMIPGMPASATQSYGVAAPGAERPARAYPLATTHQTLIVSAGDPPYGAQAPGSYPAAREPLLRPLLFTPSPPYTPPPPPH